MRKTTILLVLTVLIALSLLLSSCSDDSKSGNIHYRFPLKIGNSWTMIQTFAIVFDNDELEDLFFNDTLYIEVDSLLKSPAGEKCFRMKLKHSDHNETSISYTYVVNRQDGFYELGWRGYGFLPIRMGNMYYTRNPFRPFVRQLYRDDEDIWLSEAKLLMPYESRTGYRWTYGPNDNYSYLEFEILSKRSIEVPSGTYHCFTRRTDVFWDEDEEEPATDFLNYFNNRGLVKYILESTQEGYDEYGNPIGVFHATEMMELISYDLN